MLFRSHRLATDDGEALVLDARVNSVIGGQAMSIWYEPAPLAAEVEVELDASQGGLDRKSVV